MKRMDVVLMNMVKLMMAGLLMELEIPTEYFTNKNLKICSPIISFNNNYAYLVELDGLVFNYNWDFGNSCGYF